MIGKTRHSPLQDASVATRSTDADVGPARGILRRKLAGGPFWHARHAPAPELRDIVEHFWSVAWDLRGQPAQIQETLPHPNVHIVIEQDRSRVVGIHTGRFVRELAGQGRVFGIKFRVGGFYPFLHKPVASLMNRTLAIEEVFGEAGAGLETAVLAHSDDASMMSVACAFLRSQPRAPDDKVEHVAAIVAGIVDDRALTSVDKLAERSGLGKRALQRLFRDYVGATPKWVINRYRLHDAVEQLALGHSVGWASIALELGYFDQAHFIRDFKKLVGRTPAEYARAEAPAVG
ncbi:MAG: helix-turn-helix transcriptional regulator [Tahibacter sp.]